MQCRRRRQRSTARHTPLACPALAPTAPQVAFKAGSVVVPQRGVPGAAELPEGLEALLDKAGLTVLVLERDPATCGLFRLARWLDAAAGIQQHGSTDLAKRAAKYQHTAPLAMRGRHARVLVVRLVAGGRGGMGRRRPGWPGSEVAVQLQASKPMPPPPPPLPPLQLHTSGTSGKKKVVPYTLNTLAVGAAVIAASWGLKPGERNVRAGAGKGRAGGGQGRQGGAACSAHPTRCLLLPDRHRRVSALPSLHIAQWNSMPLFHTGGIVRNLLSPVLARSATILTPGFDPTAFWDKAPGLAATWCGGAA